MGRALIERIVLAGGTEIGGLTSARLSDAIEEQLDAGGSEVDPSKLALAGIVPIIEGETLDVGDILAACWTGSPSTPHVPITAGNPLTFYMQGASDGGTRGTGATQHAYKVTQGILIPTRATGGRGLARIGFRVYADYDGTNAPIQKLTSQTLPAGVSGATDLWRLAAIVDHTTAIFKVADWSLDFGIDVGRVLVQSDIYAKDSAITAFRPTARWATADIATALTASGWAGAAAGANGLKFLIAKYAAGAVGIETNTAISLAMRTGSFYYPVSIDLSPGAPKTVQYAAVGKGGTALANPPLAYATGQTLPSETNTSAVFMTGPAKHNTTEVEIEGGTVEFGIETRSEGPATLLWPTIVFINTRRPRIRYNVADTAYYATIGQGAAISTGWYQYLRKVTGDSEPVADGTAAHVKLTIAAGMILPQSGGGTHRDTSKPEVAVVAVKGGSAMLAIATSQTIT